MNGALVFLVVTIMVYVVLLGFYFLLTVIMDVIWPRCERLRDFVERMWRH